MREGTMLALDAEADGDVAGTLFAVLLPSMWLLR